jgi:hypothetical protein
MESRSLDADFLSSSSADIIQKVLRKSKGFSKRKTPAMPWINIRMTGVGIMRVAYD